jgi:hypothetical protein
VDKQAATEEGAQVAAEFIPAVEQKPSFPTGAVEQTAAVAEPICYADRKFTTRSELLPFIANSICCAILFAAETRAVSILWM